MKLVILDSYALKEGDLDWSPLKSAVDTIECYPRTPYEEIVSRIGNAELVIVNKCRIDEAVLCACPNLKWVGVTATGTDSLDIEACKRHNVAVANVPSYSTQAVAQLTAALLLTGCQQILQYANTIKQGFWQLDIPQNLAPAAPIELFGKTIGIIGYGEIGQRVAAFAVAMGMRVLVHTRTQRPEYREHCVSFVDLQTLLQNSDVISLHCPATEQTKQMINQKNISQMKKGVVLINTARGSLINESDLLQALQSNQIAFYGADVCTVEPAPQDFWMRNHPKVLLTPHIAWTTPEALARLADTVCKNLVGFLQGNPANVINGVVCKSKK